jgi:hypothetical protein
MVADTQQTYANHAKFFPLFHYFVTPVLLINVLVAAWQLIRMPSLGTAWGVVVAAGLVATALAARLMALAVQDRVIRLEMQLRMRQILPADLQSRIADLTPKQLVGLRFASDAELPDLIRQVLSGSLKSTTEIKKAVKNWQGDHLRA